MAYIKPPEFALCDEITGELISNGFVGDQDFDQTQQFYKDNGLLLPGRVIRDITQWPYYPAKLKLMFKEYRNIHKCFPVEGHKIMTYKQWYAVLNEDHKKDVV